MGWGILGGEDVEFRSGDARLRAHLGRPASPGRFPAVVALHGSSGLSAGMRRTAERFGDEGYVGLMVDWQSHVTDPHDDDLVRYVSDAAAFLRGLDYVDDERVSVTGYCRGGTVAYLALAAYPWLRAGVVFHGLPFYREFEPTRPRHAYDSADRIQAPVIILHGAADDRAPVAGIYRMAQRLEALGKSFGLKVYSGTGHNYTAPDGPAYNPVAAADAWQEAICFLDQHLRP